MNRIQKGVVNLIGKALDIDFSTIRAIEQERKSGFSGFKPKEEITGVLYTALQKRANAFKTIDNYFVDKNGKPIATDLDFIFDIPNRIYNLTWIDLKELLLLSADLYGNGYLWMDKNKGNKLLNIYILPPNQVSIKLKDNRVERYVLNEGSGSSETHILPADIIHIKHNYPTKDIANYSYKGTPKAKEVIASTLRAERAANNEIANTFESGGVTNLKVSKEDEIDQKEWDNLTKTLKESYPNIRLISGEGGLQLESLQFGKQGILDKALRNNMTEDIITKISMVFEVPVALLLNDYSNYATAKAIIAEYRNFTIEPLVKKFEAQFNLWLTTNNYPFRMTHDVAQYQDEAIEIQRTDMLLRNNVVSINEVRLANGYEEINSNATLDKLSRLSPLVANKLIEAIDGNELRGFIGLSPKETPPLETPAPTNQLAVSKGGLDGLDTTKDASIVPPTADIEQQQKEEETKFLIWKKYDDLTASYSKLIAKDVSKLFDKIHKDLLKNQAKGISKGLKEDFAIDVEKYIKLFERYGSANIEELSVETIKDMLSELGLNADDVLSDYKEEIGSSLKESISKVKQSIETVEKSIQDIVNEIVSSEGADLLTETELRNLIKEALNKEFEGTIANRVETIARTTANNGANSSKDAVIKKNGYDKAWLHSRSGNNPRPAHQKADGMKADKDGYFTINGHKMKHPAASGVAEEDINCDCTIIAVKG